MNDNVRLDFKLERLREYLRDWAFCDNRWSLARGLPKAVNYLIDNMKAGVADSSELRDGPNPWAMSVIDTQLENLSSRIPEARPVLLVRYLNKSGVSVYRHGRLLHLKAEEIDTLADLTEMELMPMVEREGLPL